MPGDLFEDFMQFGDRILIGIDQQERSAQKFKWLLGQINDLLKTTHGMVVAKLDAIDQTENLDEAMRLLAYLDTDALEESFRIEGMCDSFSALGRTLQDLAIQAQGSISDEELNRAEHMAYALALREEQVATLYTHEIMEVANLLNDPGSDLLTLKSRARDAINVLTAQMTDFDMKAKRFKQLSG